MGDQHEDSVRRGGMVAADSGDGEILAGLDDQPADSRAGKRVVIGARRE
jgi:hypothetical protein